ncbi:MAG: cysteine desulfurase family protein [Capnocytophaga sp.]|nr:cysteine desulfurase family protein [Capnocytophaga sp.]
MKIYFDNAATTPLLPEVIAVMSRTLEETFGNPSSTHSYGRAAKSVIEYTRKRIATGIAASPSEIIFTSGGTEANNMIIRSCIRDLGVRTIISSAIEHHSVLTTNEQMVCEYGTQLLHVPLLSQGNIDLNALETMLETHQNEKILVSLMHVNNEIGNLLPIKKVGKLCRRYNAYFHCDTVQSVGHFRIETGRLLVDFITASAHKFHGPKGVGFAYIRKGLPLNNLIFGGEQERGLRAGTEAVHNIAGLGTAFELAITELETRQTALRTLKSYFISQIEKYFPDAAFNGQSGDIEHSSHTILNIGFAFPPHKGEVLLFHLDMQGIACSKGSACQSGSNQDSHVLKAFLPDERMQLPSIRFSLSHLNTVQEIDYLIEILREFGDKE